MATAKSPAQSPAQSLVKLFPTLVYQGLIAARLQTRLNKELLNDTAKLESFDTEGRRWSKKNYKGGYTSYSSIDTLHKQFSAFETLEKQITPHVRRFAAAQHWDLAGKSLHMTTCWTSRMPKHVYHPLHIHPLAVVSGTYYVNVPKGTSALKIEDPRLAYMMAAPARKASAPESLHPYVHLAPKTGRFYLFESWLRHEVPPNQADGDRVSVSFNYEWA